MGGGVFVVCLGLVAEQGWVVLAQARELGFEVTKAVTVGT